MNGFRSLALLSLSLGAATLSSPARADAVPPAPDDCPAGTVGVTDHGGPRCEKEAPKNCPSGWRGAVGGECVLAQCAQDSDCASDQRVCRDATLCFEPHQRNWSYGQNDVPREMRERLAGPARQLDHPVTDWVAVNVCGATEPCSAPSECRPGRLCVSPTTTPKVMPRNSDGTVESRPSGCGAGCASAASEAAPSALLFALGALSLALLRRRPSAR